jgi:hypothetical protein
MLRRVALVRTDVSEELSASIIRVTRIVELGTMLTVTSPRRALRRNSWHFFAAELIGRINDLSQLQNWLKEWKIEVNPVKSTQITFATRRVLCLQGNINNILFPLKRR